ncbi:ABC transporter permease [Symbioplanes lichenis]|uniref:ABC transporter permease n=1 Tax=Symbioplanes lichenis TaxID=1629072 RepID=UPI002739956D|nr:ABC transporter permease [Actinoplanes lichenis]
MTSLRTVGRAGFARGVIELRQSFTTAQDLWAYLFPAVAFVVTIFFMRDHELAGTGVSLGARTLPSVLGMGLAFAGVQTIAAQLAVEREDGTLLRAKATPDGMSGYLVGKIVLVGGMSLISILLQLVPSLFLVDGVRLDAVGWLTLIWLVPLGLAATLPLGAVVGSLVDNPRNVGFITLPLFGLVAISGIFYPITAIPGWLQAVAQGFPVYWLGLGMRSAFLPDSLTVVELGHSWRLGETAGVLGLWAVAGLALAPAVLRRMARRESGSAVARRRERALQRVT